MDQEEFEGMFVVRLSDLRDRFDNRPQRIVQGRRGDDLALGLQLVVDSQAELGFCVTDGSGTGACAISSIDMMISGTIAARLFGSREGHISFSIVLGVSDAGASRVWLQSASKSLRIIVNRKRKAGFQIECERD